MQGKLTIDVNECQGTRVHLANANRGVDVKPFAKSGDQGTFMFSHDCQQENLPLRHASLKVPKRNSSLFPR